MKNKFKSALFFAALLAASFQLSAHNGIKVSPKMFLKGALESNGLMRDALRTKGLLPSTEPYSTLENYQHYGSGGGETVASPAVFQVTGNNAIVDWVVVELRNNNAISTPVATHAALLQRDGDVVDVDGVSPVRFLEVAPGNYHISVRHRNHLGVMTGEAFSLSNVPTLVDFSNPALPLYGTNPAGTSGDKRVLWTGDGNKDRRVAVLGPGNDILYLFTRVLFNPGNVGSNFNYIVIGYLLSDYNLDGYSIYNGPNSDLTTLFSQAVMGCGTLNCGFIEQIP